MCEAASIDVIRLACVAGFNLPGMSCDILEAERGPSIENIDEIKKLNGTILVRFVNEMLTVRDHLYIDILARRNPKYKYLVIIVPQ